MISRGTHIDGSVGSIWTDNISVGDAARTAAFATIHTRARESELRFCACARYYVTAERERLFGAVRGTGIVAHLLDVTCIARRA